MNCRGWVGASQLTVGQRVVLIDGSDATVASTERADYPDGVAVFNLEVESDHTYFVADADTSFTNPVWVHNATGGDCAMPRASDVAVAKAAARPDRPYQKWKLLIQELMDSGPGRPDPGNQGRAGVPGALRWDVPGSFNGSQGVYELVVDPQRKLILHYLFTS